MAQALARGIMDLVLTTVTVIVIVTVYPRPLATWALTLAPTLTLMMRLILLDNAMLRDLHLTFSLH
jgi:hypothetical protein